MLNRTFGGLIIVVALALSASPAIHVATAASTVTYLCVPTGVCGSTSLVGLDIDRTTNVVYAVDDTGGSEQLLRIDGNTDTYVDSYSLSNCTDPRRPTIAHVMTTPKIYIGCEDEHSVLVLQVTGGRLGPISPVTTVPLSATYNVNNVPTPFTYEPKTETANDALGLVYVVGDNASDSNPHVACNDPAFAIDVTTDTVAYTNSTMGTPTGTGCDTTSGSYTGINDVAFSAQDNRVYFFNEDDHRVYRTQYDLTSQQASPPLTDECPSFDGGGLEDAPQHGAVQVRQYVLAVASESAKPCAATPETGASFALLSQATKAPIPYRYNRTPRFSAGRVTTLATNLFLVTDLSDQSGLSNCVISCVQVQDLAGAVVSSMPLDHAQTDVTNNDAIHKAYLSLDSNSTHNIAIVTTRP